MVDKERDVMNLYKRKSETPLQTIERYMTKFPKYKDIKMTYAGRLDPMAEGVLIVLAGEKNKERDKYTSLDKDYEFEFILGIETDTFDVLGKISNINDVNIDAINIEDIRKVTEKYKGKIEQVYPAYSSKVVDGTPLFQLAREGRLSEVSLPKHDVIVSRLEITGEKIVSKDKLAKEIIKDVSNVVGDFRQKEILDLWNEYFNKDAPENIRVFSAKLSCGSGFYVRQLVADIGKDLGTGAVTTKILRTRVGEFDIKDSFNF